MTLRHGLAMLAVIAITRAPTASAESTLSLMYADNGHALQWQLHVAGNNLTALDAQGAMQWSISPSDGAAADCQGITQFTLLVEDANGDGLIDAGIGERARVIVISSWRDGGGWQSAVLTLDVSRPGMHRLLWRRDSASLLRLARLVASPTVVRLPVGGANRDPQHYVVLLGGGLPTPATPSHGARDGAALLMLDAQDGTLLWTGAASGTPDQQLPLLTHGLSGAVTALDLDRDGNADRFYVGDAVATLWRFDVASGRSSRLQLAAGPLARLAAAAAPEGRSLIAAPDVALISPPGVAPWFNVAVGTAQVTGSAGPAVPQALFVLRDRFPYQSLSQADFDHLPPVTAAELPAIDAGVSATAPGYHLDLAGGSVARALTAAGVLLYTQVTGADPLNACAAAAPEVIVKVSAVSALDGTPALDLDGDGQVDTADRAVALPAGAATALDGPQLQADTTADGGLRCRVGVATLAACPRIARLTRRYWRREDAD